MEKSLFIGKKLKNGDGRGSNLQLCICSLHWATCCFLFNFDNSTLYFVVAVSTAQSAGQLGPIKYSMPRWRSCQLRPTCQFLSRYYSKKKSLHCWGIKPETLVAIVIHVTSHVNLHVNIMLLMVDVATLSMANIHVETIYDIYFCYKYWLGLDYGARRYFMTVSKHHGLNNLWWFRLKHYEL